MFLPRVLLVLWLKSSPENLPGWSGVAWKRPGLVEEGLPFLFLAPSSWPQDFRPKMSQQTVPQPAETAEDVRADEATSP